VPEINLAVVDAPQVVLDKNDCLLESAFHVFSHPHTSNMWQRPCCAASSHRVMYVDMEKVAPVVEMYGALLLGFMSLLPVMSMFGKATYDPAFATTTQSAAKTLQLKYISTHLNRALRRGATETTETHDHPPARVPMATILIVGYVVMGGAQELAWRWKVP
jgi:hypothetical protein